MSVDVIARGLAAKTRSDALGSETTQSLVRAVRTLGCHPRAQSTLAANDIPTLTLGADWAASTINGVSATAATVMRADARLTYLSGPAGYRSSGAAWAINNFYVMRGGYLGANDAQGNPQRDGCYFSYEFNHTGTVFEVPMWTVGASGTNLRVLVNDAIGGTAAVPITGSFTFLKVQFPVSATRRIRIETWGVACNGVNVASSSEVTGTGRDYPMATILSDSFSDGTGAEVGDVQAVVMARALGLNPALAAVGGTGMINPGGNNYAGYPKVAWHHAERVRDLTLAGVVSAQTGAAADPAMGIVLASINDASLSAGVWSPYGASLTAAIENRCNVLIDAWLATRPGKPLVFFGPTWPNYGGSLDTHRVRDGVQRAAWARSGSNVWFIDRLMPYHRTGLWNNAADQASLYTGMDGIHPTAAGHRFDGLTDAAALRALILGEMA